MGRKKSSNIRKVQQSHGSYFVGLPIEIVRALKMRERQKVVVKLRGKKIIIEDWKK